VGEKGEEASPPGPPTPAPVCFLRPFLAVTLGPVCM
jgi:hypothetical protein